VNEAKEKPRPSPAGLVSKAALYSFLAHDLFHRPGLGGVRGHVHKGECGAHRLSLDQTRISEKPVIEVTPTISISEDEISERFIRSAGPGGQNVNKVSTAVELRFDVRRSPSLPNDVAIRLMKLGGRKITLDGVLVLVAMSHRTQERNRADALDRLLGLIREAAQPPPPPRKKTKPTLAAKKRRVEAKVRRGGVKSMRGKVQGED
jgi:ribosome-associated protein